MRASNGPTGKGSGAKPSLYNMPVFEHGVQSLQHVLRAKAEGIQQPNRLDLLKRILKTSIWSGEDNVEMK